MVSKPTLHFIPGLGADKRVFTRLEIDDSFNKTDAEWIQPFKEEPLPDYCRRMIETYNIKPGDILIGLSFGGMVSVEINKIVKMKKLILLSSTSTRQGMSAMIRWGGRVGLTKCLPKSQLNKPNRFNYYVFGAETKDEKEKIDMMIREGDANLNLWSLIQLATWQNNEKPEHTVMITGARDHVFPVKRSNPDFVVEGATHLMVYTHARQVTSLVNKVLRQC